MIDGSSVDGLSEWLVISVEERNYHGKACKEAAEGKRGK